MNKKIYLVCRGLSCNDILTSISENKETGANKSFFDFFNKKNNKSIKEEFNKLDTLGIQQMILCSNNKDAIGIDQYNKPLIFSSLDYASLESALVLYYSDPSYTIYPIGDISKNTGIKDQKTLEVLKKKFSTKYWGEKKLNTEHLRIKTDSPTIDWQYIDKSSKSSKSSLYTYSLRNFLKFIKDTNFGSHRVVIICEPKLILDLLKMVNRKRTKYNEKIDTIEYSSIWAIDIDISGMKVEYFTKVYPTEYEHEKLKYNDDNGEFSYEFDRKKFNLPNSLKPIPDRDLKIMSSYRCLVSKNIFKKSSEEKEVNVNEKNMNANSLYENLLDKEMKKN